MAVATAPIDYIVGLDLGQPHEFTALAVLERSSPKGEAKTRDDWHYTVPHLHRFPVGTPYTAIIPHVLELTNDGPLRGAPIVVDRTGVGAAVVETLHQAPRSGSLIPVTISAGQVATQQEDYSFLVPKKDLASHVQVLLQHRRLKFAKSLPEVALLVRELQNFKVKVSLAATDSMEAWREGAQDDLVLAVALACWWVDRSWPWTADSFGGADGSLVGQIPEGVFTTQEPPDWMNVSF